MEVNTPITIGFVDCEGIYYFFFYYVQTKSFNNISEALYKKIVAYSIFQQWKTADLTWA